VLRVRGYGWVRVSRVHRVMVMVIVRVTMVMVRVRVGTTVLNDCLSLTAQHVGVCNLVVLNLVYTQQYCRCVLLMPVSFYINE